MMRTTAADSTPGSALIGSITAPRTAAPRSGGSSRRRRLTVETIRPFVRNPTSTWARFLSVRANNSDPNRSTTESEICAITRERRSPSTSRPAVVDRDEPRITASGLTRVARNAGTAPNRMQVSAASPAVKPATRQSMPSDSDTCCPPGALLSRKLTSTGLSHLARRSPQPPPIRASRRLSVSSCRITRPRDAPRPRRIAISR